MDQAFSQLLPFVIMLGIFYFLLIRPQIKEKQEHDAMVAALAKDDDVVTKGGMHGRITSVGEQTLQLEVAKGVNVTIDKDVVGRKIGADTTSG